ncbi:hypothetical protein DKX38_015555 [Salix brachista]|uniref:ENTH domain-containing protein n=1 Tax=Salix brachista TaxID=2182728 RepID=A0A5N5L5Q3_9ROSI|nr:hypothetical protein DKX38_015555 [Salix brachista]
MHKRFRQVFCALKEHTSVSFAKIATFRGFCDVDLIIVKATAPDDLPLPEKYMHKLMKMFSFSTSSFHSFSLSFARRFGNTRSWKVALKCLILLHRLPAQDDSSSNPEAYTVYIRSYAQLLDQALDCFSLDNKAKEEEVTHESLEHKIKQVSRKLELFPRLQSLIDRVMDCIPTGVAPRSLTVQLAMKHIVRDSFICYTSFRREIVFVLDNLLGARLKGSVARTNDDQEKQVVKENTLIEISSQWRDPKRMAMQGYKNKLFCLEDHTKREEQDQWQLQVNPNPFCQPYSNFPSFNGLACNPAFPWGF